MFRTVSALLASASACAAAWDPDNADWSRPGPTDLRVMTWNVQDGICRTNDKTESRNNWCAIARIIAALKPDVLVLQECGDNSGNGTGSGVDSVEQLGTTIDLLINGGIDPFRGGQVTSYIRKYDPEYDLTYVYVSSATDNYNRNVIISRLPFSDLNGDGLATLPDFVIFADEYAPGGTGGIRGAAFAEIDLPDDAYAGDLVVGTAHLKCCSDGLDDRFDASRNIAYYIDYLFNGAGTGTPDPHDRIRDNPPAQTILGPDTPVVFAGDLNEDELTNGRRGPAAWISSAEYDGTDDGTDRDRTDAAYDDARDYFIDSRNTQGSSKIDYVIWQNSIATLTNSFNFHTASVPPDAMPPEIIGYGGGNGAIASSFASDHKPVIVDLRLPVPDCPPDFNGDGAVNSQDFILFLNLFVAGDPSADYNADGQVNSQDFIAFLNDFVSGC